MRAAKLCRRSTLCIDSASKLRSTAREDEGDREETHARGIGDGRESYVLRLSAVMCGADAQWPDHALRLGLGLTDWSH